MSLPVYVLVGAALCLFAVAWYFYSSSRSEGGDAGSAHVLGNRSVAIGGDGGRAAADGVAMQPSVDTALLPSEAGVATRATEISYLAMISRSCFDNSNATASVIVIA